MKIRRNCTGICRKPFNMGGIHVKHDFKGDTVDSLQDKRIAIS